jgi:acyl CoA:acetate/3-ketoacid CoA transferase alpha subunit
LELLADDIGMPVEKLLARQKGETFNAETAIAARRLMAESASQLVTLARHAAGTQSSESDLVAFRQHLALHTAIQEQVAGMTAEAGRLLASFNIPVEATGRLSDQLLRETIEARRPGGVSARDMAEAIVALDDVITTGQGVGPAGPTATTTGQITKTAKKIQQAKTKDMLLEAWINGLLSGLHTHAANTLSNALVALSQIPERWVAARIGQLSGSDAVAASEAAAMWYGMTSGAKDALKLAGKALWRGQSTDPMGKVETPIRAITAENLNLDPANWLGRGINLLGETVRTPGRFLMAEDEFFKAMGYRMELHAQAHRIATTEKLAGKAFADRVQEVLDNPPENVQLAAMDAARYMTFTNPLGPTGQRLMALINSHAALKMVLPFIRTPTNVFKYAFARTPIAPLVMKSVREDLAAGGARRDLAIARIGLGTMVQSVVAGAVAGGLITGGGPADREQLKALRQSGWQPYSLKIGDTYVAYNRLEPLGSVVGLAADAAEILQNSEDIEDVDDAVAVAAAVFSRQITSKTFTRGISDLIHAIDEPLRYGERYVHRLAGTVIPAGVAQYSATQDPYFREAFTALDAIKARTPWSDTLQPKRDMWGRPVMREGSLGPDLLSPVWTSTAKKDPATDQIVENKIEIGPLRRKTQIRNVPIELTPQQWDRLQVLAGNELKLDSRFGRGLGLHDAITRMVDTAEYAKASPGADGLKALMIKTMVMKYREAAKGQLLSEFPEIVEQIYAGRAEQAAALRGGNP